MVAIQLRELKEPHTILQMMKHYGMSLLLELSPILGIAVFVRVLPLAQDHMYPTGRSRIRVAPIVEIQLPEQLREDFMLESLLYKIAPYQ